jgi:hypothetical protein
MLSGFAMPYYLTPLMKDGSNGMNVFVQRTVKSILPANQILCYG